MYVYIYMYIYIYMEREREREREREIERGGEVVYRYGANWLGFGMISCNFSGLRCRIGC